MESKARMRAEEQFVASQKQAKEILVAKDKAGSERSEKMLRLKALRLAKKVAE
jgi:hypothetical protein